MSIYDNSHYNTEAFLNDKLGNIEIVLQAIDEIEEDEFSDHQESQQLLLGLHNYMYRFSKSMYRKGNTIQ